MRSFPKPPVMALVALTGILPMSAANGDTRKGEPATPPAPPAPPAEAAKPPAGKGTLELPVPKGQPQKGLKVPIYDLGGILRMTFRIGTAVRGDDDKIKMSDLRIETFKGDGGSELDIDLPESVYSAKTMDVTSDTHVTIKNEEFLLTGEKMTFNIETKVGKLGGGVRMVIHDLSVATAEKKNTASLPTVELKPKEEPKK